MELNITSGNPLKMLGKKFIHIIPNVSTPLINGGKYNANCDNYGNVGQVECLKQWVQPVCELSDAVALLSDDLNDWHLYAAKHKLGQVSKVQVCVLRFIRRKDEEFEKLMKRETINQGLTIFQQQTIF